MVVENKTYEFASIEEIEERKKNFDKWINGGNDD